ncbi:MAG: universal stress protein [Sporichthyaceae bacterium]
MARGIDRIAVGVDSGPSSTQAVRWAAEEARRTGAAVELVHALTAPPIGWDGPDTRAARAAGLLAQAAAAVRSAQVCDVASTVVDLPAGPALVELSHRVDLLVVGGRDGGAQTGAGRIGSVGQHVGRYAACPVVVVRRRPAMAQGRVVVQLTGYPSDRAALEFAFDHAAATGAEIEAIHAWALPPAEDLFSPLSDEQVERSRRASEVMLAEELAGFARSHPDVQVLRHSVPADPRDVLLWASAHADLVVISAPRPFDGLLARPSAESGVLRHAHCPVVVAR